MNIREAIEYAERLQAWRTGKDVRTMDDAGITPNGITECIDSLVKVAKAAEKLFVQQPTKPTKK